MKLLINTSTLYVGGGLQVALSFINELKEMNTSHDYHIFLSQAIDKQLDKNSFAKNFHFYLIERSPASLKTRKEIVERLDTLEDQIQPDIVFSVFGPSYWKPKTKHLMGFADGWVYNPDSVAYNKLSLFRRWKMRLHGKYKSYYLKKDANYFMIETEDGKNRMSKVLSIAEDNISVVGNTYSTVFNDEIYLNESNEFYLKLPPKQDEEFRLMYIAHNHINKNLTVINDLLPLLSEQNIKFVLTLDETSFNNLFPAPADKIINLGPISQKSCPSVYKQSDALFAPTLLETFSAVYPEAMKMEKPILTSNYSFATDVCQDAALYFDPLDPKDIAEKIKNLVSDKVFQQKLVEKGKKRVQEFETARTRAEKYLKICENIVLEKENHE